VGQGRGRNQKKTLETFKKEKEKENRSHAAQGEEDYGKPGCVGKGAESYSWRKKMTA